MTSETPDPRDQTESSAHGPASLARLERGLEAFEAARAKASSAPGLGGAAGEGYRVLGQMLGGVLGGVGLGWLADKLAHTSPLGLVMGLVLGSGLSIYSAIRTASRLGADTKVRSKPVNPDPTDEVEDEA